jgi:cysteine desulfurase
MEPSHVLKAMNVPLSAIHGSVRFCVSRYTEESEIDSAVEKVSEIVTRLREMSPFGRGEEDESKRLSPEQLETHKAFFSQV